MFHSALPLIVIGVTAGFAVIALLFGDNAARLAGAGSFVNAVGLPLYHMWAPGPTVEAFELACDFLWAVALLVLLVRHASLWLGATMLLQSVQFGLHAYYIVMNLPLDLVHAWVNNLDEVGIALCILAGTLAAVRGRALAEREAQELARGDPAAFTSAPAVRRA